MRLNVVHITDLHIRSNSCPIVGKGDKIASAISTVARGCDAVLILVTGDVAFSGSRVEYLAAKELFSDLLRRLRENTDIDCRCLFTPGNHDLDFSGDTSVRDLLLDSLKSRQVAASDRAVWAQLSNVQSEFFRFKEELESSPGSDDPLWQREYIEFNGKRLRVDQINIACCSALRESPGTLAFPVDHPNFETTRDADLVITAFHHPANWLRQGMYQDFRRQVRKMSDLVFTGHEHVGDSGLIKDLESEECLFFEGYVFQQGQSIDESAFSSLVVDFSKEEVHQYIFEWNGEAYVTDEQKGASEIRFPSRKPGRRYLSQEFVSFLDDPGGLFRHPVAGSISLSDVFVYPDLQEESGGTDAPPQRVSAEELIDPNQLPGVTLVFSEESSGRTALLKTLYMQYFNRGFIPIYLEGSDLKHSDPDRVRKLIRASVEKQYGEERTDAILQASSSQRIIMLDDLHLSPINKIKIRRTCIEELSKWSESLIVTVDEAYKLAESLIDDDMVNAFAAQRYQLQPLNHSLRYELIEKWYSLGHNYESLNDYLAKCKFAVAQMSKVIDKSLIPSSPLYALVLLQGLDESDEHKLKEGGLGHYYQFLITDALFSAGVNQDELGEYFQYCSHLSWFFHNSGEQYLSESDLRAFNEEFSRDWHTVDFVERFEVLTNARVVSRLGDEYKFRYPYIYYFFKGYYIGRHSDSPEIECYLRNCCRHLYVRDYANTVLFSAHHVSASRLASFVQGSLSRIFQYKDPIDFGDRQSAVEAILSHAEEIQYLGGDPEEHGRESAKYKDSVEIEEDGLADTEEESDDLSVIAQVNMLLKSSDILGQIIKNQYASITRNRRIELIEELFEAPLRTLADLFDALLDDPTRLEDHVKDGLLKKGLSSSDLEARSLARKLIATFVEVVIFAFLSKTGDAVNSQKLREDVAKVSGGSNNSAYKLIEVAAILDSPSRLPISKMDRILSDFGKSIVVRHVLRMMVVRRLYMYKTERHDLRWAEQTFSFDRSRRGAVYDRRRKLS